MNAKLKLGLKITATAVATATAMVLAENPEVSKALFKGFKDFAKDLKTTPLSEAAREQASGFLRAGSSALSNASNNLLLPNQQGLAIDSPAVQEASLKLGHAAKKLGISSEFLWGISTRMGSKAFDMFKKNEENKAERDAFSDSGSF